MNCPNCTARLTVVDSRAFPGNQTKRRLVCAICGERFNSLEKIMTDEEISNANSTQPATAAYYNYTETQPAIDLSEIFAQMAKNAIVKDSYTSALTGGVYESEEDALKDTIKELNRLYNERF